jgi:hypothetical protein
MKTFADYKKLYAFETKGKSTDFKIGWLEGALATTNNLMIRRWLQNEIYVLLKNG